MSLKIPLRVVFYKEPVKPFNSPVHEWLEDFNKDEKKKIGHGIMVLQCRWPLGMPLVENIGKGLWELRIKLENRIIRITFILNRGTLILLHGFVKKTQKTSPRDLEISVQRKKKFEFYEKELKDEKK